MKKIYLITTIAITVLLVATATIYITQSNIIKPKKKQDNPPKIDYSNTNLDVILSLEDTIKSNNLWCGTFNLVWNDLKNDLAKKDIIFTPQLDIVNNLNKSTFTTDYLSDESYYKTYGKAVPSLKEEIEKAIKTKFNETSDILDSFNFYENNPNYFLYTMLKKEFEFPYVFDKLEDGEFNNYQNVKYFGIDSESVDEIKQQVNVLYYNSDDDFAIKLITKNNDEIILSRGVTQNTFLNIYNDIKTKQTNFKGNTNLNDQDTLKIPYIDFKFKKEFKDLENKPFLFSDNSSHAIDKAIQTINFSLNEKGGKIKSEAGIGTKEMASLESPTVRHFDIDDTFIIFLKEKNKDLPYFAAFITNITEVQEQAQEK